MKDFFGAGSETTATTLGWVLYFMLKHPDVQTKVRVSNFILFHVNAVGFHGLTVNKLVGFSEDKNLQIVFSYTLLRQNCFTNLPLIISE